MFTLGKWGHKRIFAWKLCKQILSLDITHTRGVVGWNILYFWCMEGNSRNIGLHTHIGPIFNQQTVTWPCLWWIMFNLPPHAHTSTINLTKGVICTISVNTIVCQNVANQTLTWKRMFWKCFQETMFRCCTCWARERRQRCLEPAPWEIYQGELFQGRYWNLHLGRYINTIYVELQDQWNGPYFFS